jgi:hypothetical protein
MPHRYASRIVEIDRTRDQRDVGTGGLCCGGDGKALFAGRAIGDVAHRVDRLVRRSCGDEDVFAGERAGLGAAQKALGGGGDFGGLRHPADSGLAGFGHFAGIGADHGDAIALELHDIAAGRGIVPH